jgi:hypothetical protein
LANYRGIYRSGKERVAEEEERGKRGAVRLGRFEVGGERRTADGGWRTTSQISGVGGQGSDVRD